MELLAGTMDSISPYFLHISLLFVSLSFLYLAFRPKSTTTNTCCPLPPGKTGWPILGESLYFLAASRKGCPENFVTDRTSKYSPDVFRTSLLGENLAVFCGAPGNKFVLSGDNKYLKMWLPSSLTKVLLFPENLGDLTKLNARKTKIYLSDFLKPEALKHYVPIMDSMAKDYLMRDWLPNVHMRVFPSAKGYTFDLACRIFMNIVDAHDVEKLSAPFTNIMSGLFSVPINIPGTPFSKAVEGGREEDKGGADKRDKEEEG